MTSDKPGSLIWKTTWKKICDSKSQFLGNQGWEIDSLLEILLEEASPPSKKPQFPFSQRNPQGRTWKQSYHYWKSISNSFVW